MFSNDLLSLWNFFFMVRERSFLTKVCFLLQQRNFILHHCIKRLFGEWLRDEREREKQRIREGEQESRRVRETVRGMRKYCIDTYNLLHTSLFYSAMLSAIARASLCSAGLSFGLLSSEEEREKERQRERKEDRDQDHPRLTLRWTFSAEGPSSLEEKTFR